MPQKDVKTKKTVKHTAMNQFDSRNGELLVNGVELSKLKLRAGQTPFYAYDRSIITQKINQFRQAMPDQLKLHYALKANPMPALVGFVAHQIDGIDVASGNELNIALNSDIPSRNISFAGPSKQLKELRMAISSGTTINIESFTELERIVLIKQQTGINAKVAIRINPDFELKSSGMKMGGGPQQFGIDAELVTEMLTRIKQHNLEYRGLHIFTGTQNLNAESIILSHQKIFELATRIQRKTDLPIQSLNIGGGLGIPYFPGEQNIQLKEIGKELEQLILDFTNEFGCVEIAMELGRYIVGDAGIYVAEINDIKTSRGTTFAVIDGGLHHHLSASGNFGQVIRKNYPVCIGNKMEQSTLEPIQIVGPLCTPLDIMANKYELPHTEIGDLVVIYQSGAYGYSASPRDFLNHPQPVEMLV